jgi:hypothetical protein
MIEDWILAKIDPLKPAPLIIVRDPGRIIRPGARAIDGWAEENGYTVFFCTGNLGLRDMYEAVREEPYLRAVLIDRSREAHQQPEGNTGGRLPLFYPDLEVRAGKRNQIKLSLRDYFIDETNDPNWPPLVENRNLTDLLRENPSGALAAYQQLRDVNHSRFSDTDLYKIVLGTALQINPFRQFSPSDIRRICIEHHHIIEKLGNLLPDEAMDTLRKAIEKAPVPFCFLLKRDPDQVIMAFTLAAILHQHGLDHRLFIPSLAPELYDFREIDPKFLDKALEDQLNVNPDQVAADVKVVEAYLSEQSERLAALLRDQLRLDEPEFALNALRNERLSPLIRGMAITSLLFDLVTAKSFVFHKKVMALLDEQADQPTLLASTARDTLKIESAYIRAFSARELSQELFKQAKQLRVLPDDQLEFELFDRLWNGNPESDDSVPLNRLDYYFTELDRLLRNTSSIIPLAMNRTWPEFEQRWVTARESFATMQVACGQWLDQVNQRFQDLYVKNYLTWIKRSDSPVIFTHQFLSRVFQTHWKPNSQSKAIILIFDGLRIDAWEELLSEVFEERFEQTARFPASALLPTETQLTRKAISAGCLPAEFTSRAENQLLLSWIARYMPDLKITFDVKVNDDQKDAGMSFRAVSDQVELIVFKFTDENLHHNASDLAFIYDNTVRALVRDDVRSLLRELPDDAVLFITSDHGFTPYPTPVVEIPSSIVADDRDVKYRNARVKSILPAPASANTIWFDATKMGIPTDSPSKPGQKFWHVLFPRPGYVFRRTSGHHEPDKYGHGGVSMAECLIPMIVMTEKRTAQRPVRILSVKQVGASLENELLTLEIVVNAVQAITSDMQIEFTFNRPEIAPRRETFSGESKTYRIEWKPVIGEENRSGDVIRQAVSVTLSYRHKKQMVRIGQTVEVRIKLDPARLRRRVDSKLDLIMGKVPQGLK